jgi:Flp pilus assembly protein TadD
MLSSSGYSRSARVWAIGVLVFLLGVLVVALAWRRSPQSRGPLVSPSPDPRLTYTGRFLNVHPSVGYVGDAVCGDCHIAETQSYRAHPMGRSLAPIGEVLSQIPKGGEGAKFTAFGSCFYSERRGERLWHCQTRLDAAGQPIYTLESEVQYVIGSGTRGYSFLSERDGYLFQTPISWFSQKRVWGLSPGFTPALFVGRPVSAECLYCHAHRVRPRPNTDNGYEKPIFEGHAIGCERCHGPGERHVQERSKGVPVEGAIDYTIFNPSRRFLAEHENEKQAVLRDAVCEQCHLSGEVRVLRRGRDLYDFRPGLPLYSFWSVFVRDHRSKGTEKAVNHVEQMHLSRCYQESSGERKLECVSCHNPHEYVTGPQRLSYYRARCLECHEEHSCALPRAERLRRSKEDSCIDCHMPRYAASDIPHTAATDHRIPRHKSSAFLPSAEDGERVDSLQSFYRDVAPSDPELARDQAVALTRLMADGKGEPRRLARQVLDLLGEWPAAHPDDVPAWEAQGAALAVLGRSGEALFAFEQALGHAPDREYALRAAGRLAQESGDLDKAVAYWRRAVACNPQAAYYHGNLALLLAQRDDWRSAREQCRTWLDLDPGSLEARRLWIRCLRKLGERQAARTEMERLRRLEE